LRIITLIDNICGSASPPSRLVKMLNRPDRQFMAEQGLSVIIEMENGQRVLFDTGSSEQVFLHNLRLLGLEPKDFNAVVISHGHYDHVGGLVPMIEAGVPIFAHPKTFIGKRYSTAGEAKTDISTPQRVMDALAKAKLNLSTQSIEVIPGVRTSGEIARTNDFEQTLNFIRDDDGRMIEDINPRRAGYLHFYQARDGGHLRCSRWHSEHRHAGEEADPGCQNSDGDGWVSHDGCEPRPYPPDHGDAEEPERGPHRATALQRLRGGEDDLRRFVGFELMPTGSEIELVRNGFSTLFNSFCKPYWRAYALTEGIL